MTLTPTRLACITLLCIATATPCRAESFASSASSAGSASSGSVSDSIHGSSNSSSRDKDVAEGDYRIIEVTEVAERPAVLRLKMQATAPGPGASEFFLDLPRQTLAQHGLAPGNIVSARHRPYGLEFARAQTREAFFLVLRDDWQREFDPHAVAL
ncbi:hypothetical protein [Methylibium sp.]|uniref:hypothetical protein n=1 Tax=Methylibium sp. TaxID=2067992 RepID=UPI003D132995